MGKRIAVIPGDGIGTEVTEEAVKTLDRIGTVFGHVLNYEYIDMGGCSIDKYGTPLTDEAIAAAKSCDAVLLGAVGGPKWDKKDRPRPEEGLLGIRKALGVYANLRPAVLFPQLRGASPLKESVIGGGIDIMIVRELTGGIYFGKRGRSEDGLSAFDTESYSVYEIERILRVGAETAMKRRHRLCVVDKANILASSKLWREVAERALKDYPELETEYMYVDNASMQLIRKPTELDVIVTSNMFGDILSDEAAMLTGSIGMLPSASLGDGTGLYEPVHGSAPDIAGTDTANPCAAILSAALLLRYSFGLEKEAKSIESAVGSYLAKGFGTRDIAREGYIEVGTKEAGRRIREEIQS